MSGTIPSARSFENITRFLILSMALLLWAGSSSVRSLSAAGDPTRGSLGSIEGRVTDASTGAPLPDQEVAIVSEGGGAVFGVASTDGDGRYEVTGRRPGGYFVAVGGAEGSPYLPGLWEGVTCGRDTCDTALGDLVQVAAGQATTGIDFELSRGASIRGRVLDAVEGAPLGNASFLVYDASGSLVDSSARTDGGGRFEVVRLEAGT